MRRSSSVGRRFDSRVATVAGAFAAAGAAATRHEDPNRSPGLNADDDEALLQQLRGSLPTWALTRERLALVRNNLNSSNNNRRPGTGTGDAALDAARRASIIRREYVAYFFQSAEGRAYLAGDARPPPPPPSSLSLPTSDGPARHPLHTPPYLPPVRPRHAQRELAVLELPSGIVLFPGESLPLRLTGAWAQHVGRLVQEARLHPTSSAVRPAVAQFGVVNPHRPQPQGHVVDSLRSSSASRRESWTRRAMGPRRLSHLTQRLLAELRQWEDDDIMNDNDSNNGGNGNNEGATSDMRTEPIDGETQDFSGASAAPDASEASLASAEAASSSASSSDRRGMETAVAGPPPLPLPAVPLPAFSFRRPPRRRPRANSLDVQLFRRSNPLLHLRLRRRRTNDDPPAADDSIQGVAGGRDGLRGIDAPDVVVVSSGAMVALAASRTSGANRSAAPAAEGGHLPSPEASRTTRRAVEEVTRDRRSGAARLRPLAESLPVRTVRDASSSSSSSSSGGGDDGAESDEVPALIPRAQNDWETSDDARDAGHNANQAGDDRDSTPAPMPRGDLELADGDAAAGGINSSSLPAVQDPFQADFIRESDAIADGLPDLVSRDGNDPFPRGLQPAPWGFYELGSFSLMERSGEAAPRPSRVAQSELGDPWIGRICTLVTVTYTHGDALSEPGDQPMGSSWVWGEHGQDLVVTVVGTSRFRILRAVDPEERRGRRDEVRRYLLEELTEDDVAGPHLLLPPRGIGGLAQLRSLAQQTPVPAFVWRRMWPDHLASRIRAAMKGIPAHQALLRSADAERRTPLELGYWLASNMALREDEKIHLLQVGPVERLQWILDKVLESYVADSVIECKECTYPLARASQSFTVGGCLGTTGNYVNPHGHVHQVLTVREIDDDAVNFSGRPETRDTWFPGYSWTCMSCDHCFSHLGWEFRLIGGVAPTEDRPAVFFGLSASQVTTVVTDRPRQRRGT